MENESIWADGCPEVVNEEDKLPLEAFLGFAVNHIVRNYAIPNGFKIDQAIGDKIGNFPNIIMKKDGVTYAVAVLPSIFPNYLTLNDSVRKEYFKVCKEHDSVALFAPVGFRSVDDERAKAGLALKGDVFNTAFNGFVQLTDEDTQNMFCTPETAFRP